MFRIVEQTQAQMQQGYFSNSDIYVDGYGKLTLVNRNMQTNLALNKPYTRTDNSPFVAGMGDTNNRLFTDGTRTSSFRYSSMTDDEIVVDLGSVREVGGAFFTTGLSTGANTPEYIEVSGSLDGINFKSYGKDGQDNNRRHDFDLSFSQQQARYMKFRATRSTAYPVSFGEGEVYAGTTYVSYREQTYDISSVGFLRANNAYWMEDAPIGTSVALETSISLDGGVTWTTWKPLVNGSSIQNAPLGTDISNGRLKIRTTLSSSNINVPSFYNFNMYFDDVPKTDEKYIIIPRNAYSLNKITPEMTSSNEPAPYVVTGTGTNETSYPSWKLFDGLASPSSLNDMWRPYGVGTYVQLDLGSGNAKAVSGYRLQKNASSTGLTGFRIEGSFDGVDWVTVDEQSAAIWSGNELFQQISPLKTNEVYRYFRLYMTTGERPYLTELELFELVDGNGYQIKSSLIVPYGTSLPSMLYIPPHNKATGYVDVRPIYHENLPARVSIKVHDNLSCRINIPINNRANAIVNIVQQPTKTLSLSPIKDAFVRESAPKFNYGTEQDLYVGYNSKLNEKYRSFIEFDLSALPADQIIKFAHFRLFYELEGAPIQKVELFEVDREWNERGITWDNQPLPIAKIAELDVGSVGGYLFVDFTDIAKDWYEGNKKNNGFIIKLADESEQYYKRFYSRESRNGPILDIEYIDQTVYTYENADLRNNHLLVRQTQDADINSKINVHQIWFKEEVLSRIKVANMGVIDSALIVKNPVLPCKITVRQFETEDIISKLRVQIKSNEDVYSQIMISKSFSPARVRVRQRKELGLAGRIIVRRSDEVLLPSRLAVSNPVLHSKISIVKSEYLTSTIRVVGLGEKEVPGNIVIRRSENKDISGHIKVFEKETLQSKVFVISDLIRCRITIPHRAKVEHPSRIRVRVKWANDLTCRLIIDDPYGDSQGYVYIL